MEENRKGIKRKRRKRKQQKVKLAQGREDETNKGNRGEGAVGGRASFVGSQAVLRCVGCGRRGGGYYQGAAGPAGPTGVLGVLEYWQRASRKE